MTKEERKELKIKAKAKVAEKNGYTNILGSTAWEYMMMLHSRTKKQLRLYEQVIDEILNEVEKSRSEAEG